MLKIKKPIALAGFTFILTTALLMLVEWKVAMPMLLLERFLPGWGWQGFEPSPISQVKTSRINITN